MSLIKIPYNRLIQVDKNSSTPIYMQIANQFSNAIQRGIIPMETKLPGTRKLAELLGVNRNTVVAGFDELIAQGWIKSIPNKGTFTKDAHHQLTISVKKQENKVTKTGYSFVKSNLLDNNLQEHQCKYYFTDGTPDVRLALTEPTAQIFSANLKRKKNVKHFDPSYNHSKNNYKKQLVNYVNLTRNLQISTENILTTNSEKTAIYLITKLLLQTNDCVVVGEYSYYEVNMIIQSTGARICRIPEDKEGIDTQALEKLCRQQVIRMVYLNTNHHYPTTNSLSIQRRVKLLQLTEKYGFVILEDDSFFDFYYQKNPNLPLISNDENGMVVYVSSIGKVLTSEFSSGIVVAPIEIIKELNKINQLIGRTVSYFAEETLAELIDEGILFRHQKKVNAVYYKRQLFFSQLLQKYFGSKISFSIAEGDLALWIVFNFPINLMRVRALCMLNNLYIPTTLLYQNKELSALRLGFAHLTEEEMEICISVLYKATIE